MPEDLKTLCDEADRMKFHGLSRELTERQLEIHPDNWPLLLDLAVHETTFCRYEDARAAIDRAEQACPRKAMKWILSRRGHLCDGLGDFKRAEEYFLEAHEADPDNAAYLIYAASAAFKGGATDKAIELVTRATQCKKGCIEEAFFNLGGYLLASRRFAEARECYCQALKIDPEYRIAKKRLADVESILALPPRESLSPRRES